ncbi:MAG: hypothetical protein JO349_03745, partial [Candidatus Eremiobacteraeota bacterium]|nr:hypothetical protein [Candidatus Eremiobacteraeota bacterium]
ASLGEEPGVIVGDVDSERVATARAKNPSIANSWVDIYARWIEGVATTPSR